MRPSSLLVVLAALLGAFGVADAAIAAHVTGGAALEKAAEVLMVHAAALTGLAALVARSGERWTLAVASAALGLGAALFGTDVTLLTLQGHRLFPYAAPTGGSTMISAWLIIGLLALAGHLEPRRRD